MTYFTVIGCALLAIVFYQDVKYRGVSWYLFPLLALVMAWKELNDWPLAVYMESVGINFFIIIIQLGLFYLISINIRKRRDGRTGLLGLGDLLFFGVMAMGIEYSLFPILFTISLVLSLVASFLFFRGKTIPLAGLQAVFLLVCILFGV